MRHVNVIGQKFHWMTILDMVKPHGHGWQALCRCECGNTKWVLFKNLPNGHTRSCGCLSSLPLKSRPKWMVDTSASPRTGSRSYRCWQAIKQRCLNPNNASYRHYGGRGITICERWMNFDAFLEDMGDAPDGLSLDRINNDGGYCPENCRWADKKTQSRNSRQSRKIAYAGKTLCVSEWAEVVGIRLTSLRNRLARGWTPERMFTQPLKKTKATIGSSRKEEIKC
jgi:hypothetical protein